MSGDLPHPGGAVVVLTTVGNAEQAGSLARGLVSNHLAGCATAIPGACSTYFWEGRIHQDSEILLIIKTMPDRLDALERFLNDQHPYQLPEFIVLSVQHGSPRYLDWLRAVTGGPNAEEG